jgi:hypothetical protein
MALQDNALIELSDLKGFLSIPDANTDQDTELETLINYLSDLFDVATARHLRSGTRTELRDGDGTEDLYLRDWPIEEQDGSSVVLYIDYDREYAETSKIERSDFMVYQDTGLIRLENDVFPCFPQVAKVIFPGGYHTIPGDLRLAIKEACMFFRKRGKNAAVGVSSISASPGGTITYLKTDLPKTVQTILARYRRTR